MNRKEVLDLSLEEFIVWPYEDDDIMLHSTGIGRFDRIGGNDYSRHGISEFWFVDADKQDWLEAKAPKGESDGK